MIAYVRRIVVGKKKWIDQDSFQDGVALCQTIPGATVMQMAAYVGLKVRGVRGAMACYAGFSLPAFVLMLALSVAYTRSHALPAVVSIFSGLQAIIVAVVANATLSFGKTTLRNPKSILIALLAAGLFGIMASPVFIIILAAFLGILFNDRQTETRNHVHSCEMPPNTIQLSLLVFASGAGLALLFLKRKDLFDLALLMSKIDLMAFGGGFASIPLMFHEVVEVRSWMDAATFLNGIALGQFSPGPIVITATFVGYLVRGMVGAFIATLAIFVPSFLILIGVAPWFDKIRSVPWFSRAIGGVLCSFVGLLFSVTIRFALNVNWDWPHMALSATAFIALILKVDILWVVLLGTAISAFIL